jgi:hypothetical protein
MRRVVEGAKHLKNGRASQVAEIFQLAKDHASRDVKALLGGNSQLAKG